MISEALGDIKSSLRKEREFGKASWFDLFKNGSNKVRTRTLTGMGLQACQQLTGINFIFYFGTTFFTSAGISNPFLIQIATNIVNVGMTIPGILAVDRAGRRFLLLFGAAGMCFCEFLIAILGVTLSSTNTSGQKTIVGFVCIYIVSPLILSLHHH